MGCLRSWIRWNCIRKRMVGPLDVSVVVPFLLSKTLILCVSSMLFLKHRVLSFLLAIPDLAQYLFRVRLSLLCCLLFQGYTPMRLLSFWC